MSDLPEIPTIEDAIRRLDARPDPEAKCWQCGHVDKVPPDLAAISADPEKHSLRCGECGAVTAYGTPMPRLAIMPHADRRFVITKMRHGTGDKQVDVDFTLDRGYAAEYAMELLRVCDPVRWRAVCAIVAIEAAARSGEQLPGGPPTGDTVVRALDTPG